MIDIPHIDNQHLIDRYSNKKEALLNAIQSSSNEDFDVVDVLYVVAKTYKDKQYFGSDEFDNTKKTQRRKKSKTIRGKNSFSCTIGTRKIKRGAIKRNDQNVEERARRK